MNLPCLNKALFVSACVSLFAGSSVLQGSLLHTQAIRISELHLTATAEWADSETTTFDRPGFSFEFPVDWKVADHQPDYNPDRKFTIDTDRNSYITIEILKAQPSSNNKSMLKNILFALDGPAIKTFSRSKFKKWGQFAGAGRHLKGKILSLKPGGIRVFSGIQGEHMIVVTEFYYSSDLKSVLPGFDLISQTFEFKDV